MKLWWVVTFCSRSYEVEWSEREKMPVRMLMRWFVTA